MLIRAWRDHHKLSLRAAGRVLGMSAPQVLRVERGSILPSVDVAARIYWCTKATGPAPVDTVDIISVWHRKNPAVRAAARQLASGAKRRLAAEKKGKRK